MNNTDRHCDTCNDSYYMTEKNPSGGKELVRLQHCRNTVYNSPAYAGEIEKMKRELLKLRREVGDTDAATPRMQEIMDEYYW